MTQRNPGVENILNANDHLADENHTRIDSAGFFSINLIASPGAGKTSLIEQTLPCLKVKLRIATMDGDIAASTDLDRAAGAIASIQIMTSGDCHLDAVMLKGVLDQLDLTQFDLFIVENVRNLVCPANFKLGTHKTVLVGSILESDDKPYK